MKWLFLVTLLLAILWFADFVVLLNAGIYSLAAVFALGYWGMCALLGKIARKIWRGN